LVKVKLKDRRSKFRVLGISHFGCFPTWTNSCFFVGRLKKKKIIRILEHEVIFKFSIKRNNLIPELKFYLDIFTAKALSDFKVENEIFE
jgi:hypothetical protein